jgi:hypothetical protein
MVTAAVAIVAAGVAVWQVREARRLRAEQAQPYVAVYLEPTLAAPQMVDIVIRNFGTTAAYEVRVEINPPPQRAPREQEPPEAVWIPGEILTLVPGQEWRTFWDSGPRRNASALPHRHEVTVRCRGGTRKKQLPEVKYVLDWGAFLGRRYIETHGIHDVATSLREIRRTTESWTEGFHGLAVYSRDGDAADALHEREINEYLGRQTDDEPPASGSSR